MRESRERVGGMRVDGCKQQIAHMLHICCRGCTHVAHLLQQIAHMLHICCRGCTRRTYVAHLLHICCTSVAEVAHVAGSHGGDLKAFKGNRRRDGGMEGEAREDARQRVWGYCKGGCKATSVGILQGRMQGNECGDIEYQAMR